MANRWTEGETLFARYLAEQGIAFAHEPMEIGKMRPIDFIIQQTAERSC
jgi:hypothetical protein